MKPQGGFLVSDLLSVKDDFPQIKKYSGEKKIVYLDSAATTLKPQVVIDRIQKYYEFEVANVHRGAHFLANQGTSFYEQARETVANFIGAKSPSEVIFTRGTTEGINLLASALGQSHFAPGDEILLTVFEHHSNIVPWQLLAEQREIKIKVATMTGNCDLDFEDFKKQLSPKTKLVSFLSVSNALGTVLPVEEMVAAAKGVGALVLIDGAQSVPASKTRVEELNCDFLVFSGHKIFGPTGIGILWGKEDLLNSLPPYQGGGSMIDQVSFEKTTFLPSPQRFESGTPNVAGAIGLGAAIDYVSGIGIENIYKHEKALVDLAVAALEDIDGVKIVGTPGDRLNVVSFQVVGVHPNDIGTILDQLGIAVRVGHHCCQPLMDHLKIAGTVRASLSVYNDTDDVAALAAAVKKSKEFF